jgi:hypothetical protein
MRKPEAPAGFLQIGGEVARDLGDPLAVRVGGDTQHMHDASLQVDHEQHVVATEHDAVDVEEVHCHDAFGLRREELLPGRACRRRAGGRPWRRSAVATLVFDTETLSFFSTPKMRT